MIHINQLNAIVHHTGLGNGTQLNHRRVAHSLLGYDTDCTSFIERTTHVQWIGGHVSEWPARYALFK